MYGYIYKTVNLINQHVYIGQKKGEFNPEYFGSGKLIVRAIRKHGLKCFRVKQIASAEDRAELDVLEIHYIKKYRKTHITYNISDGGLAWHITHVSQLKRKHQSLSRLEFYKNPINRLKRARTAKRAMTKPGVRERISNTLKEWAKTHREHYVRMGQISYEKNKDRLFLQKGHIPWNKGVTGYSAEGSGFPKGHTPWNKGKPFSKIIREKMSKARKNYFKRLKGVLV